MSFWILLTSSMVLGFRLCNAFGERFEFISESYLIAVGFSGKDDLEASIRVFFYHGPHTSMRDEEYESERPDNKARGATIAEAAHNYEFNIEHGLAIVGSPEMRSD